MALGGAVFILAAKPGPGVVIFMTLLGLSVLFFDQVVAVAADVDVEQFWKKGPQYETLVNIDDMDLEWSRYQSDSDDVIWVK